MEEDDSFITEVGTFCYTTMPLGLKNAGDTYQRLVNKLQIGKNMEVYVDDMLVKSRTTQQLAFDLREVLEILSRIRISVSE